jgi:hypothetical protein
MPGEDDNRPGGQTASSRRAFLRTTGLAGLGATALSMAGTTAASATTVATASQDEGSSWRPDGENTRFTLVVMPDTQYLFDGASLHPEPVEASFRYVLDNGREENIVFMAHLGDSRAAGSCSGPSTR